MEREKKSKVAPRKVGEQCRNYGEQSDSMAHNQTHKLRHNLLTTANTCHLPSNGRNDNGHRFAMIELNQVEDSAPHGGKHSGRARTKPQLTMTSLSKDDAKVVLSALSEALKSDGGGEKYDIDYIHTKEQADERHEAYMAPRKRKPRKKRNMSDIQREEDPGKLYVTIYCILSYRINSHVFLFSQLHYHVPCFQVMNTLPHIHLVSYVCMACIIHMSKIRYR